ncbi:cytochrome P450 2D15 [Bombina bombina]|uniref:cytochrome P450 2D15 n=1 Tax=Bombina bombina TaxID=8345 RepID=UPI00235A74BC|nr:cytochrome P450 2D15 [Bombina bombina]
MALLQLPGSWCPVWNATLIGLAFLLLALLFDFMKYRRRGAGSPPGPCPLPFVGNIFLLDFNNLPDSLSKLRDKYGNVFSLQMFKDQAVVVSGYEAVKEALVTKSEDTADRPSIPFFEHLGFDNGIAFTRYNREWKERRRFALSTLRDFGMGKKSIAERVREEAGYLCSAFRATEGQPFDPYLLVYNAVSNVICSIVFGDRFDYDDEKFQRMILLSRQISELETGISAQMLNIFPWLMKIPGPHQKLFVAQNNYLDFLRSIIKEHKDTWDPNIRRDFIDAFLEEIDKSEVETQTSFNETTLLFTTADLFTAGTETTSTTIRWSLLYMLLNPHIQKRVHEEIDNVIGRNRLPTMEDQPNMPFTNAVIHETQRQGNILPLALFHMAYKDTSIQGFNITKGTTIIPNLTSVLKDETIWEKPYQFYPEHFLDAQGHFVKREALIPFSAGRRICVGEQLAKMDLFLLFTSLLQQFNFSIPSKEPRPREDPVYTFSLSPAPFRICAEQR